MAMFVNFKSYQKSGKAPALMLVGLHDYPQNENYDVDLLGSVLKVCDRVLRAARELVIPIAFVRWRGQESEGKGSVPGWLPGFEPQRTDMVFDLASTSLFSNISLAQVVEESELDFAIAGIHPGPALVSTAIEASLKGYKPSFLSDALICPAPTTVSANKFNSSILEVLACCGETLQSYEWQPVPASGAAKAPRPSTADWH
jgi:hypothetical protein